MSEKLTKDHKLGMLYAFTIPIAFAIQLLIMEFFFNPIVYFVVVLTLHPAIPTFIFACWFRLKYIRMLIISILAIGIGFFSGDIYYFNGIDYWISAVGMFISSQIGYFIGKSIKFSRPKKAKNYSEQTNVNNEKTNKCNSSNQLQIETLYILSILAGSVIIYFLCQR